MAAAAEVADGWLLATMDLKPEPAEEVSLGYLTHARPVLGRVQHGQTTGGVTHLTSAELLAVELSTLAEGAGIILGLDLTGEASVADGLALADTMDPRPRTDPRQGPTVQWAKRPALEVDLTPVPSPFR
jgi:hypothetical protein